MGQIVEYYAGCNKSRTHWELETVYDMVRAYINYRLSDKETKSPYRKRLTEDEYLKNADKLFGKR